MFDLITYAKCYQLSGGSRISQTGGANPQGGGANLLFCPIFPKNCMKMKEFGPRGGGGASLAPLRSVNVTDGRCLVSCFNSLINVKLMLQFGDSHDVNSDVLLYVVQIFTGRPYGSTEDRRCRIL